jgi:hypothetical protein
MTASSDETPTEKSAAAEAALIVSLAADAGGTLVLGAHPNWD